MKRPIPALMLAAAAFVSMAPCHAQSSVTVFGLIDTGISHYRVHGGQRQTAQASDGLASSRLGLRGQEDLGGGLSAHFWLEGGVAVDDPAEFNFARRSTVGLTGPWGEVRLGRDYTPTYMIQSEFSGPWVTNGVGESLVYRGRATLYGSANGGQSTHVRASNSIGYFLPKSLGGFAGQLQYAFPEAEDGSQAGRYLGGKLTYKQGPWRLGVAYSRATGGRKAPGTRPRDLQSTSLGVAYDFGVASLEALYAKDHVAMPLGRKGLEGLTAGLTVPVGQGEFRVSYAQIDFSYPSDQARANKLAFGYVHHLSKRTALYATYAQVRNRGGAAFTVGGDPAGIRNQASSGQNFGIRHLF
ncbi:porin [Acidovorax sp. Be4]|uniref:Porin n=1 Tax=Acidovorax bellezanensis TaxID=2976702 RepID=A0ABT2PU42_9BURK|nr:porin [Acidovorax sp. Be4]MCT9813451.1 porin [Acidovorax sp. Be4]